MSSRDEDDRNAFLTIYQPALNALASEPETACAVMGNANTPWQIQDEVGSYAYLADSRALALDDEQREGIRRLADGVKSLPPDAIAPENGCVRAMRHPAWAPLRKEALLLAELLEPVFDRVEDELYED